MHHLDAVGVAMAKTSIVVELGNCLEIVLCNGDEETTFNFDRSGKNSFLLCSNPSGKKLIIFITRPKRPTEKSLKKIQPFIQRSENLYQKWSDFKPDGLNAHQATEKKLKQFKGEVVSVTYRSDKWTGKMVDYIHTFENKTVAHMDDFNDPRMIEISGQKLRVKAEGITG